MADKQRAQVCSHNKDKSHRSRLTHARIRALPFDLERKPLLGEASFLFFSPLFHVPVRTFFLSTQIGRVSRRDAPASRTASVLRRSGVERKRKKKKWRHMNRSTFNHRHLSTSARRLPVQACGVFFGMHGRRS